ncbi:hypothetical protein VIGAN_03222700 [Vigna angularis var. angularis]|uniref:Flowering-promoting factor 1-like protein 2 n=5 Tax=Phaseoleae TaxID=163735 RepID=A0A0S3RNT3_PHAAN|nr:flowering-promoting factor 1-like protein 2 [Vigna angularis]BAT82244.1 hypothetical protein VIGAN_03222700 [Vigna angularis var. angularis]
MSGVWMFKNNGVYRLVENPQAEGSDGRQGKGSSSKRKVLVHLPSGEVVSSYAFLEQILTGLGWERYYDGDPDLYQFHKHSSIDLISLPKDFSKFNSINMYDIVIKNPNVFHVRDKIARVPKMWKGQFNTKVSRFVWLRKTERGPGILISTCCLLVPNFHGSPHLKRLGN